MTDYDPFETQNPPSDEPAADEHTEKQEEPSSEANDVAFDNFDDSDGTRAYYEERPGAVKQKSRGFAVASLILGIMSLVCCCFEFGGLAMGAFAVLFAILSRRELGYFDGMSIAGLILGACGLIFGITIVVLTLTVDLDALQEWADDYVEEMEKANPSMTLRVSPRGLFRK